MGGGRRRRTRRRARVDGGRVFRIRRVGSVGKSRKTSPSRRRRSNARVRVTRRGRRPVGRRRRARGRSTRVRAFRGEPRRAAPPTASSRSARAPPPRRRRRRWRRAARRRTRRRRRWRPRWPALRGMLRRRRKRAGREEDADAPVEWLRPVAVNAAATLERTRAKEHADGDETSSSRGLAEATLASARLPATRAALAAAFASMAEGAVKDGIADVAEGATAMLARPMLARVPPPPVGVGYARRARGSGTRGDRGHSRAAHARARRGVTG